MQQLPSLLYGLLLAEWLCMIDAGLSKITKNDSAVSLSGLLLAQLGFRSIYYQSKYSKVSYVLQFEVFLACCYYTIQGHGISKQAPGETILGIPTIGFGSTAHLGLAA